jgi:hypothetical protein
MARINVSKSLNEISGHVNAAQFTWNVINGVLQWIHGGKVHHTLTLTADQIQTLNNGGRVECSYECGTLLVAQK